MDGGHGVGISFLVRVCCHWRRRLSRWSLFERRPSQLLLLHRSLLGAETLAVSMTCFERERQAMMIVSSREIVKGFSIPFSSLVGGWQEASRCCCSGHLLRCLDRSVGAMENAHQGLRDCQATQDDGPEGMVVG